MKLNCPNCSNIVKTSDMKLVRKDHLGRKAKELWFLYICPHCKESLVRNKHYYEMAIAIVAIIIPGFVLYVGIMSKSLLASLIAIGFALIAGAYGVYVYKTKLKNWHRWMTYSEYIKKFR